MLQKLKLDEYPIYVEKKERFVCFLKRDKEWEDDVLKFLNVLLAVEMQLKEKLFNSKSVEEYVEWCNTQKVVTLKAEAAKYAVNCKSFSDSTYFVGLVDDLVEKINYLLSDKCVQPHTDN